MEWLKTRRRAASQHCLFLAVLALAPAIALPLNASAEVSVGVSVGIAPPPLPIYVQPAIPAPGYIWVPGYWAWDGDGYYWVPGTWVFPPYVGALWTPGYWGWGGGVYVFHRGYWGPHVGFYGGINYGYGYTGVGYAGGYWRGRAFYYNRSVNHIDNVHITNVYSRTVVTNANFNRASFNGGHGGIAARPSPRELGYAREQHVAPVAAQEQQRTLASQNQGMRASFNHGAPAVAATPRAGAFNPAGGAAHAMTGQAVPAATHAVRNAAPTPASNNNMALHSSGFAPRGNPGTTSAGGTPGYHPVATMNHAAYTRGPANPAAAYHSSSRPQPTYAAHASPMPAYHPQAARPAAAPHAQPHATGAPHGGPEHR
jgi:hypothetical protein